MHGGITEKDIKRFLDKAEENAKQNRARSLDTVVFFDEANTTEAIGLIKEIMCDRRLHGKSISDDLKFIAACNPYRRSVSHHSAPHTTYIHVSVVYVMYNKTTGTVRG